LSSSDYRERKKNRTISPRLPYKPNIIYKSEGWISWGDYLGTGRVADQKRNLFHIMMQKNIYLNINFKVFKILLDSKKIKNFQTTFQNNLLMFMESKKIGNVGLISYH